MIRLDIRHLSPSPGYKSLTYYKLTRFGFFNARRVIYFCILIACRTGIDTGTVRVILLLRN